jgi:hypothetical protein
MKKLRSRDWKAKVGGPVFHRLVEVEVHSRLSKE